MRWKVVVRWQVAEGQAVGQLFVEERETELREAVLFDGVLLLLADGLGYPTVIIVHRDSLSTSIRYSTALSGLLNAALMARSTSGRSKPIIISS